jgi:hypothetical protein
VRIRNAQQKTRKMKTYKINFLDIEDNTIYSKIYEGEEKLEASVYASLILANTSDECVTYEIFEL